MKTQKGEPTHTNPLTMRQNTMYPNKGKGSTDTRMGACTYRN